jgi:pyrimidine-specific ribonucleoside hydrolase
LALGPLTNVATTLQRHPELTNRIERIVAVAGRRPQQKFIPPSGRVTLPDLNFESDVEAFQIVLEANIPLTLVPYEVSSRLWIALSDLQAMRRGSSAAQWFANQATGWLDLWAHAIGLNGFNPFDALVLTYLISPDFLHCQTNVPAAIQSVPDNWWKFWLFGSEKQVLAVSDSVESPHRVEYCFDVDPRAKAELLRRIESAGNGPHHHRE